VYLDVVGLRIDFQAKETSKAANMLCIKLLSQTRDIILLNISLYIILI